MVGKRTTELPPPLGSSHPSRSDFRNPRRDSNGVEDLATPNPKAASYMESISDL